ncbi:Uncharacterized protein DBV15_05460 [Temnothorax longispinosus]|uniref:Uncharacterized protein n=1 Tax=Temnothorax longispinosus TaxID=300112 RepID=A0A4S2KY17_9HYME|nr:Uncharacterized protein DBV15_05460 [Temnothorax longispinosus]
MQKQEERACERSRKKSVEAFGALGINAGNELARDLTHRLRSHSDLGQIGEMTAKRQRTPSQQCERSAKQHSCSLHYEARYALAGIVLEYPEYGGEVRNVVECNKDTPFGLQQRESQGRRKL